MVWVGGYRLGWLQEGGRANILLQLSQLHMEDQKKTLQWSGCLPKEPQLNFLFQLLQRVWIVSLVRNKLGTLRLMDGK